MDRTKSITMTLEKELQETWFDMSQVANICQIKIKNKSVGRNELFKLLRKKKILQEGNNLPYKRFIDAKYFLVKKIEVERVGQYNRENLKTTVSLSGIEFIKNLFKENI